METELIKILLTIIGSLLGTIAVIISWIGLKIYNRLEVIENSLSSIEKDLRGELTNLDRRVSKVETRLEVL